MRKFALLLFLVVFGGNSVAWATPIEWTIAEGGNGNFYEAVDLGTAISWDDAKANAEAAGGYLATITSAEEDAWVRSNLLPLITPTRNDNVIGPWIGGYQDVTSASYSEPSGGWAWVTGEPWSYTAWQASEPSDGGPGDHENVLHYFIPSEAKPHKMGWNDSPNLSDPDSYLIEYAAIPEPSTGLLLATGLLGLGIHRRRAPRSDGRVS